MISKEETRVEARQNPRIGAVVLAAGSSRRMGEPKQLLELGGKTILEQVLGSVRATKVSDIVVVLGFHAETIAKQVSLEGIKVAINEAHREGMGGSLRAGLSALDQQTDATLIVLADQPFVRSTTLDLIIDRYQQSSGQIVIPTYQGFRGNPVLLDRSVFHDVMALTGDIGCRAIFGDHTEGIVEVPVADIGVLLDIDSKEDYARLQSFGQSAENRSALIEAADLRGREILKASNLSGCTDELIIVGTEPVGLTLVRLGKLMHFRVTIADPLLKASEMPDADEVLNTLDFSHLPPVSARYVVMASRGRFDEEAIEQAFAANAEYVGLVANRRRAQEVRRSLQAKGHLANKLATLRAPAGLDISAKTPEEIALSIMAEIVSLRRKTSENKPAASAKYLA
jgi:molybdenum cofactor cytidylyltransferase